MKRGIVVLLVFFGLLFVWTSADVQAFRIITKQMMEEQTVTQTDLIRTVNNFIVLFDTSSSTNQMVPGKNISKIAAAKAMLDERNAWLPDLGYNAGLYIYTSNETL
jgi:hypothetical protein